MSIVHFSAEQIQQLPIELSLALSGFLHQPIASTEATGKHAVVNAETGEVVEELDAIESARFAESKLLVEGCDVESLSRNAFFVGDRYWAALRAEYGDKGQDMHWHDPKSLPAHIQRLDKQIRAAQSAWTLAYRTVNGTHTFAENLSCLWITLK